MVISFTKTVETTNVKLRFMPSSLRKLALFLNNDEKMVTKRHCVNNNEFNLLTRKGVTL